MWRPTSLAMQLLCKWLYARVRNWMSAIGADQMRIGARAGAADGGADSRRYSLGRPGGRTNRGGRPGCGPAGLPAGTAWAPGRAGPARGAGGDSTGAARAGE